MKILHVNKFFDLHGGAEVYMHDLMREQNNAGHEVHALATRSPKNLPSRDASRFVTRYDLSVSDGPRVDAKKAMNYLWNREAERAMDHTLCEIKPDIVHLHNIYNHLSTSVLRSIRRAGVPCVQTLHDLKLACPNYRMYTEGSLCERCKGGYYFEAVKHHCISTSFLPNMLAALEMGMTKAKQSYERTVHTFICPSQFMADKMIEWGEPASKFSVIRAPVVLPKIRATREDGYLLAVGRLSFEKGYELLIRAARHVPHARIKIAGRGPEEDRLRALIKEFSLENVELVGYRRGEELAQLYREADAFIACPIGYENAPIAVLDALGYGLPVLASRIGGLPEMVEEGRNGFLAGAGNIDEWITILKKYSAVSVEGKKEMADASRLHAETFFPSWVQHVDLIAEVYGQAMKQGR